LVTDWFENADLSIAGNQMHKEKKIRVARLCREMFLTRKYALGGFYSQK